MLKATFQHLKGIGKKTEKALWKQGIISWDKYLTSIPFQKSLFSEIPSTHILAESIDAYASGNIDFFAKVLPPSEYYRVILDSPEEVLFLDIETTGLSVYYDIITLVGWSLGKSYNVMIHGGDETAFREAVAKAKAMVTFNGTLFDLKFIEKYFDDLHMPLVHLDLRYFAKRVGLSGGQKKIESDLGFKRTSDIEGMLGEAAPILWHKYRRGECDAMKRLIEYNHADIEGMKYILKKAIDLFVIQEKVPQPVRGKLPVSKIKSKIKWAERNNVKVNSDSIYIPEFEGSNKPLVTYSELNQLYSLDEFCCVGIDLVSSEERETGFCILRGNKAFTCRVKTDDEMIKFAIEAKANLISIDSPLSIPKGRTTFFDDDPMRQEFGIMRECERILHRRGIKSYPCLIQSMQKLTQRGMLLAQKFRKAGIPVIESYPGAAQDIMSIPRKQAGLEYLVDGLKEFGLTGEFTEVDVSHDELDAITSAIVGHFFWVGMFEGLGNLEEEYLIIPDLNADYKSWLKRSVVGLSGQIASGKTTTANLLIDEGYTETRYSRVVEKLLLEEGVEVSRSNLQAKGLELNEANKQRWLGKKVVEIIEDKECVVIDGLRFLEDRALMLEMFGPAFRHLHVRASLPVREKRVLSRNREDLSLQESQKNPVEMEIARLGKMADYVIINDGSVEELLNNVSQTKIPIKSCQ